MVCCPDRHRPVQGAKESYVHCNTTAYNSLKKSAANAALFLLKYINLMSDYISDIEVYYFSYIVRHNENRFDF